MAVVEALLQFPSTGTLLGAFLLLLVVYLLSSGSKPQKEGKDPPGPKPLPLLGNLLTLDLERPFDTLCELSKTYGNVFQVFFGPKKVVILAGYKTVKEALVNYADEFGDRDITPGFRILNDEHGIIFSNGENWKEMRRFALTNLRDFGMGKRGSEEKIIEEIQYLKEEFEKFEGKPFDTTQPVNYAVSNIISAIVYGNRFEYTDFQFKEMVDRANENVRVGGSASMTLYSIFPWLGPFLNSKRIIVRNLLKNRAQITELISGLLETLNPQDHRGFIDSFLIRKQSDEGFSTGILLGILLLFVVVYLLLSGSSSQDEGKEPPGPKPLPLLGNLLMLDLKKTYVSLCDLSKQYGSVFTVHFGPKKVVVLAGYKTVKQALVNLSEEFGDRDITPIFHDFNQGFGILFSNGENWRQMRRFALSNLRDFGMGKKGSEEKIIEESKYLREEFEKFEGKPFDTSLPVSLAISNIILSIVYGNRFEYSNPWLHGMVQRSYENMKMVGSASVQLYNMFPWLCPFVKNQKQIMNNLKNNFKESEELINGLLKTLDPQDPRGFADSFLVRQQKDKESAEKETPFHTKNLFYSINNLFAAGTDTTTTTLCWSLLLMAKYPEIQDKVQEEIDRVIGGRQPVVEDRKNLPYTDAVIHETQRLASILPISVPRKTSCDVHLNGYLIKKDTSIVPLLITVLRDENEWETPNTFNPGHFLNKQGQFIKNDAFMPFSAGRRVCVGESLARMELFLFFTSLLQNFRFTPPPGMSEDELDLTPSVGFTLNPSPHKLCAVKRS
ncbi:cytochrome P450 2K6-like [Myxocyprinus asiaticus]|uniref:cytochrome P450 2K6-like n=1 Tax=Myxocyprinus asiaticus TaxID=70543 RepID=UPI002223AAC8|nr:cytochrome P450 2K6-like [Myxocyprinus asiaticus]